MLTVSPTPPIQREVLPHTPTESGLAKQGGLGELRARAGDTEPAPPATSSASRQHRLCLIPPLALPRDTVPSAVTLELSLPLLRLAAMNVPGRRRSFPHTRTAPP